MLNEQKIPQAPVSVPAPFSAPISGFCPVCHQPVLSQYYFCPNCGAKLNSAPLSTSAGTQAWIYAFSIILPMICFIFVTRWPGIKYFKSDDPKAKMIGKIAWTLLVLSTITTVWLVIIWTQQMIQSSINSINTDFNF
jgi:hypothetical protein